MIRARTSSPDTRPAAESVQLRLLRECSPGRRAALAFSLSSWMIRASRRAVAKRHPELDEADVALLWVELHYGAHLASRLRAYLAER